MDILDHFKKGDLLYGIEKYRTIYKSALKEKVGHGIPVSVDEYNNFCIVNLLENDKLWTKAKEASFLKKVDQKQTLIPAAYLKQHYRAIKFPSYKKISITNNDYSNNKKNIDEEHRKVRRACKARMLDSSITIHFMLDGLNACHLFNRDYSIKHTKNNKVKGIKCLYDSYTSAELHFVFKHFEQIESHIKFYLAGKEISLFDWIKNQNQQGKYFIRDWAKSKYSENKLSAVILEKISTALEGKLVIQAEEKPSPEPRHALRDSSDEIFQNKRKTISHTEGDSRRRKLFFEDIHVVLPSEASLELADAIGQDGPQMTI